MDGVRARWGTVAMCRVMKTGAADTLTRHSLCLEQPM